jgi:hypothetical protein
MLPPLRRTRVAQARARFDAAYAAWFLERNMVRSGNRIADEEFQKAALEFAAAYSTFDEQCTAAKKRIADLKAGHEAKDPTAVTAVAELILAESKYSDLVLRDLQTGYYNETGLLVIEDTLPGIDAIPRLSKAIYVASRKELRTTYLSDAQNEIVSMIPRLPDGGLAHRLCVVASSRRALRGVSGLRQEGDRLQSKLP